MNTIIEIYDPQSHAVQRMAEHFLSDAPIGELTEAQRHTIGIALRCLKQSDVEALWEAEQERLHGGKQP